MDSSPPPSGTKKVRVLFVDDEPNIRLTLPAILRMHNFDVTAVGSVAAALAEINEHGFDVLIADLNIGEPGDGFTVVSAMRRTQPEAVTIIMTGFPAFETALEAIRSQVDDYVVKPARVERLVEVIQNKLQDHTPHHPLPIKSVATILRENKDQIVEQWLHAVRRDPEFTAVAISDTVRAEHIRQVLDEIIAHLEQPRGLNLVQSGASDYGRSRRVSGFTMNMLISETRVLREVIASTVQENLLAVDVSNVIGEMTRISACLDLQLTEVISAYVEETAA
jgi:DNA-binding response OmpR family regulator